MDRYIGTKIILAEPMEKAQAVFGGLTRDAEAVIGSDGHSEAGYAVLYEDGYRSWSPKAVFERAYRRMTNDELTLILSTTERSA